MRRADADRDEAKKRREGQGSYPYRREDRLRKKTEFDRIFRYGARKAGSLTTILAAPNELARPRLGVCVGKKYGKAVRRNRFKRVVREAFRLTREELPPLDIVVLARKGTEPTLDGIARELVSLAGRIGGSK